MAGAKKPEELDAWQLAWELKNRGSLGEVRNQLRHARSEKYLNQTDYADLSRQCSRALGAVTGLRNYLLRCPKNFDPRNVNRDLERGTYETQNRET